MLSQFPLLTEFQNRYDFIVYAYDDSLRVSLLWKHFMKGHGLVHYFFPYTAQHFIAKY